MNFSPTRRRISAGAFTLVEMMIAAAVFTVVGTVIISVLRSTMQLSSENVVANLSNFRARQALDRAGEVIRYGQGTPVLINADGTTATSTTTVTKADGTTTTGIAADGVLIKNALGGPYIIKNSNGKTDDIPSGATSFTVEYTSSAGVVAPTVGDYFLINLSTQPELEVTAVGAVTVSGKTSSCLVTTKTGLTEIASPSAYAVNAMRYRREAYVFAANGTQWDLRRYPSVTSSTVYTSPSAYVTMGTGFQKLVQTVSQPWFTTVPDSGTQTIWMRAVARSSDHGEYNEYFTGRNTLTAMPVQGKLWNYSPPPLSN